MTKNQLYNLFKNYCKKKNWDIIEKNSQNNRKDTFSFYVTDGNSQEEIPVKLLDWKRSVGVDQVIRMQKSCENLKTKGILVTNSLSQSAESICITHGLVTITRQDLLALLQ